LLSANGERDFVMDNFSTDDLKIILDGIKTIATIVAACALFLAVRVLRFNAFTEAQKIYTDKIDENISFIDARTKILSHFGYENTIESRIGKSDEKEAFLVCRMMDKLARLEPYLGKKEILRVWGVPLGKSWMILRKTVEAEQAKGQPKKWDAFERMGKKAMDKHNLIKLNEEMARAD
jgi:hypothetical protein